MKTIWVVAAAASLASRPAERKMVTDASQVVHLPFSIQSRFQACTEDTEWQRTSSSMCRKSGESGGGRLLRAQRNRAAKLG